MSLSLVNILLAETLPGLLLDSRNPEMMKLILNTVANKHALLLWANRVSQAGTLRRSVTLHTSVFTHSGENGFVRLVQFPYSGQEANSDE